MSWKIRARGVEACSRKMVCQCTLGPAEPDQEWCSGSLAWEVMEGESNGVDLAGAKFVLSGDLPGDFLGGIDVARLYIDGSEEQRAQIDAIIRGERGGVWGGLREAIAKWLPTRSAAIAITHGDGPSVTVEGVGSLTLQPLRTENGDRAVLEHAPVAAAFGQTRLELAVATGSKWADPDMRAWESLGYGATSTVEWSG